MTIMGYLQGHWELVFLLAGFAIVLSSDIHLDYKMVLRMAAADIMMFVYSVSCYMEAYLGSQPDYTILRPLLSAFNYSLITFILVTAITIMFPALLNAVLCFISVPTGIVFRITHDNAFLRGPLGYLTYFIDALYIIYLLYNMFSAVRSQKEDYNMTLYLSLITVLCLIMPLFMTDSTPHWFNMVIAVDLLLYYIYLLQQFTKRDPLTKLLNRQSCHNDVVKFTGRLSAVVAMDMNGLKELNDNSGHKAGDHALKALADCFVRAAQRGQRVYRIGGDEFMILCIGCSEADVVSLVERIRQEVAKTPYTCAVGYAFGTDNSTAEELYRRADAMLYEDKKQFYERTGKDRRKVRK